MDRVTEESGRLEWGAPVSDGVRLTLFDVLEVHHDGRRVQIPGRCRRLLALLALRCPLSRSGAAGLLWPEVGEEQARASLRAAVCSAQRVLPGLVTGSHEIRLNGRVTTDVADFRRLARASRTASEVTTTAGLGTPCPDTPDPLELLPGGAFGGPLLPDWNDDWVIVERELLGQLRLHALDAFAARSVAAGDLATALELGAAAVRTDPLRESAHRRLMQIHLADGNAAAALRQFEEFRRLLRCSLGIGPSRLMLDLAEQIRCPAALVAGA